MCHHKHLNIFERESILKYIAVGLSIRAIAKDLGREPSTVSRELSRNGGLKKYSPAKAEKDYAKRRKRCGAKLLLSDPGLKEKVRRLLEQQWSPEQISGRMAKEQTCKISYLTIYRAINRGIFETTRLSPSCLGIKKQLRHHGRHKHKNSQENRGKLAIPNALSARPSEANNRVEAGHFEADTVLGYMRSGALLTMVDRKTRFLYAELIPDTKSATVNEAMLNIIAKAGTVKTITPDQGKEFFAHSEITQKTGVKFYFPPPGQPWKRGTVENTNGLLRQYFPKRKLFTLYTAQEALAYVDRLNRRPRKILNWLSPLEFSANLLLHLT